MRLFFSSVLSRADAQHDEEDDGADQAEILPYGRIVKCARRVGLLRHAKTDDEPDRGLPAFHAAEVGTPVRGPLPERDGGPRAGPGLAGPGRAAS